MADSLDSFLDDTPKEAPPAKANASAGAGVDSFLDAPPTADSFLDTGGDGKEDWLSRGFSKVAPYVPAMPSLSINPEEPIKSAISAGLETVGVVPSEDPTKIAENVLTAPVKLSSTLSSGSGVVQEKVASKFEKKGMSKGYANLLGFIASMPFDPQAYVPLGAAAKVVSSGKLTAAGTSAAEKVAGSLVARTGEELVQEVIEAAKTGDVAKLSELVDSGKTNLFYSEAVKAEIAKAKEVSGKIDNLNQIKTSIEGKTAQPLKAASASKRLQDIESRFTEFLSTEPPDKADALIARRDALAQKNFNAPSKALEAKLQILNQRIADEIHGADANRVDKIADYRKQISDLQADVSSREKQMVSDISDKVVQREAQLEKLKNKISDKFVAPLEKDVVEGVLQMPDSGLMNKYVRTPMQGLTFLTDTLDKYSDGAFSRYVTKPQIEAEAKFDSLAKNYLEENASIYQKFGIKAEEDTSFRLYREGKIQAPKGRGDLFKAAAEQYTSVVKKRMDSYNTTAKRIGMPEIKPKDLTPEEYVYHTKKMNALFDLSDMDIRDIPKDAMFVKHNDPIFHSYKRRFDVIPEEQLAGAFEALDKYSMNIAKVEAYGEQANKFRALSRAATDFGKNNLAEQFGRIADRLTGDAASTSSTGLQQATGGFAKPGLMGKVNQFANIFAKNAVNSASAAIGNLGASVMNALYLGPRRATASMIEGMTKNLWEHVYKATMDPSYELLARKYSKVIKIHGFERPETFMQRNLTSGQKMAGLYQNTVKSFFNYMNDSMNIGTWNQAFKAAKTSGYAFEQSVGIADNLVARTQAIYREAFRPSMVSSSSALGKIGLPLSTYVFNAANAFGQDVMFGGLSMAQKAELLAGALATGFVTNVMTKAATGKSKIDAGDFVPFLRSFQYGMGGFAVPGQAIQDVKRGHPWRAAIKVGAMLTPYGSAQIPITLSGAEAISKGKTQGLFQGARALAFGAPRKE